MPASSAEASSDEGVLRVPPRSLSEREVESSDMHLYVDARAAPIQDARVRKGVKCRGTGYRWLTKFQQPVTIESTSLVVNCVAIRLHPTIGGYLACMAYQHRLIPLALVALLALGCRKDKGSDAPSIRIIEPGAGYSVSVPDTVVVGVIVEDDVLVKRVVVMIADASGVPIAPAQTADVGSRSSTVRFSIPLVSEGIQSGPYQIIARVYDEDQDVQAFQSIQVYGAPLRRRSIFLISGVGTGTGLINRLDSAGEVSVFASVPEIGGAAITPERLYTCGLSGDPLLAWNPANAANTVLFQNPGVSGSAPYFWNPSVDASDGRLYVGTWDGLIRGFLPGGGQTFNSVLGDGFQSRFHVKVDDRLVSLAYSPVQDSWRTVSFTYSAGVQLSQSSLALSPSAAFASDDSHLLIFGNQGDDGSIVEISVTAGGSFTLRQTISDPVSHALRIGEGIYVFASQSGLHRYERGTNSALMISTEQPDAIAYDAASGLLLVAIGTELRAIDPMSGNLSSSWILPGVPDEILVLLNR